ncbi:hypothetical protein [Limnohabitans sp. Rim8]|uniref:hypothetical protein n=1 Tax=Limnohabitans sp. Rim8 TaxID=1100718 RepID=UPI0025D78132|nr:hypothetical protein [Limnohabitans sp. Rim8]
MKPDTPCWPSAERRQSARCKNIILLTTFQKVTPCQDKKIEVALETQSVLLDVRKIDLNRVPDNLSP